MLKVGIIMAEKTYYAARKGRFKPDPLDFRMFKKVFLHIFNEIENVDLLFREATGDRCVDRGEIHGLWGSDIETYIYLKLKYNNIWPLQKNIGTFDEPTLFTVIEFLYDYVSEPQSKYYHSWKNCGWHASKYDRNKGKEKYRLKINEILKDYDRGYQLSSDGEIVEVAPTGFEPIFVETVQTEDHNNIDNRIKRAKSKYRKYGATIDDKKDAIRSLADVLEFLKKEGINLPSKDDDDLFRIINGFDIRHHNRLQQGEYTKEIWYDWMFYTFLSSINVILKLRMEQI